MAKIGRTCGVLVILVFAAAKLFAQAGDTAIAGVVRDSTGAVLPGVTVEAASPVLLEKVRTVTTDEQGQYKVLNLRPGMYSITFSLSGFTTIKREQLELLSGSTANVMAEMKVGAVEETVIVSGQTSTVEVHSAVQHNVMTRDHIEDLPTGGSVAAFAVLIPGVVAAGAAGGGAAQDVGGTVGERQVQMSVHGSRSGEMPLLFDGMKYNNLRNTGGGGQENWTINTASVQEIVVDVGSHTAESMLSGVRANVIPKEGGNTYRGQGFFNFADESMGWNNIDDELRQLGVATSSMKRLWDFNASVGGPFKQDKLWFFSAFRQYSIDDYPANTYHSQDPLAFVYPGPDTSRPAVNHAFARSTNLRLTWQATPRNKISVFADDQQRCACQFTMGANVSPEASTNLINEPMLLMQTTWSAPVTNKLLFEAGATMLTLSFRGYKQDGLSSTTTAAIELGTGMNYRAPGGGGINGGASFPLQEMYFLNINTRAKVSYVTGSHAFQVGMQTQQGYRDIFQQYNNDISIGLLRGVPTQLNQYTTRYVSQENLNMELGLFVQDQWTRGRLTLNPGLRFDYINASLPAQELEATTFVGARSYPQVNDLPKWFDLSPRVGGVYDLFGNGKTAIKGYIGRYVQSNLTSIAEGVNPALQNNQTTRRWTDTNGNFDPFDDCDLKNPAANGSCGPINNQNFGTNKVNTRYDPDYLTGWHKRGNNWEVQAAVQTEVATGMSVTATYTRHWFSNFLANRNLLVDPATDYSPFCVTAPVDSRLPGGGGNQVCGFYDINPDKFGQADILISEAGNYGKVSDVYNGVDLTANVRLPRGVLLQGGSSTGRETLDSCDLVGKVNNPAGAIGNLNTIQFAGSNPSGVASPSALYCHIVPPIQTQAKVLGVYPLPWWGLQTSLTYQSLPGPQIVATYAATNAEVQPTLGRPLSGNALTTTVQLVAPATMWGERLNQFDFRLSKNANLGRVTLTTNADLYNLFNGNAVLRVNNTYGPTWMRPTAVVPGRFFKFTVQATF